MYLVNLELELGTLYKKKEWNKVLDINPKVYIDVSIIIVLIIAEVAVMIEEVTAMIEEVTAMIEQEEIITAIQEIAIDAQEIVTERMIVIKSH